MLNKMMPTDVLQGGDQMLAPTDVLAAVQSELQALTGQDVRSILSQMTGIDPLSMLPFDGANPFAIVNGAETMAGMVPGSGIVSAAISSIGAIPKIGL